MFLAVGVSGAQEIPAPPSAGRVFPAWRAVTDTASARKLFVPMDDTLAVERDASGCVRLPVKFSGSNAERASWDLGIKADLRGTRGVQFDFYCRDLAPFTSFSLYFHSGKGWYHASFGPEEASAWQHVVIDKSDTRTEGEPAGWGEVTGLRLSAWRGGASDTVCALANLGPVGGPAEALVIRADSNIKAIPSEAKAFGEFAGTVSATLDDLGVESAQVADTDLTPDLLEGVRLAVLPYNPQVPERTAAVLRDFVGRGGKLLACYALPNVTGDLLGLCATGSVVAESCPFAGFVRTREGLPAQPAFAVQGSWRTTVVRAAEDRPARVVAVWRDGKGADTRIPAVTLTPSGAFVGHVWFHPSGEEGVALLRAVVGELVPDIWRQTAERAFARIGAVAGAKDFAELNQTLKGQAPRAARKALAEAAKGRDEAGALLKEKKWPESVAASGRAETAALRAWALCQRPAADEQRAFWCHSAFGLKDKGWNESVKFLKANGFNAVLPNMAWGGLAYYPSRVLPEYPALGEKGDQIAQCLAACKKYGVKCFVWKVDWNTGGHAPQAFLARMKAEGRTQKAVNGQEKPEWLCPSHPENQTLEVSAMLEIVRNYAVDGVHFDYIRYPDDDHCFCDGCRARFEASLGHAVAAWPADVLKPGEVRDRWLDFRRANISVVVRRVSEEARKIRPGIRISAAVFRNWPIDRDGVGQDWKLWCDNGWLDFVCPMDYIDSNSLFKNVVTTQKAYAGKVPLYPGIGLSCWKNPRDAVKITQQIAVCRALGLKGFTVFNYDGNAESVLPFLRLGATAD